MASWCGDQQAGTWVGKGCSGSLQHREVCLCIDGRYFDGVAVVVGQRALGTTTFVALVAARGDDDGAKPATTIGGRV